MEMLKRNVGSSLIVALALFTACRAGESPGDSVGAKALGQPKNLILVIADTWRVDHFLASSGPTPLTPHLGAFAQEGVVFSEATSVADSTAPGTAAIMTGLLPWRSGVLSNGQVIQTHIPTLSTYLRKYEYQAAAFIGNRVLRPGAGFERGLSTYQLVEPANADLITDRAIEWLDRARKPAQSFFLWLHYMDPHGPYDPPKEFLSDLDPEVFENQPDIPLLPKGDNTGLGGIPYYQRSFMADPDQNARSYLMRYAGEVRFFDYEMGRLLRYLELRNHLEDTLLVLTSDHGEALAGDHGFYFSHDNGLTEDQVRVPLLIYFPGCDRGSVVDQPVSTVDILPTVLEVLGLPAFEEVDGKNLLVSRNRNIHGQKRQEAYLRKGQWKLRWRQSAGFSLFNLASDPQETEDLTQKRRKLLQNLSAEFWQVMRQEKLAEPQGRHSKSEEERKALEALGYV